jgi:Domain of unknown function (DUF3854)
MTVYPTGQSHTLSDSHRRMLFEESGIAEEVATARGYRTIRRRSEVPDVFANWQRRLGLLVPTYSPDRETSGHQLRPNKPITRKNGNTPKYETPAESQITLDINPLMLEEVRSGDGDLWVTEGPKKVDALTSHGEPSVGIIGVWNFAEPGSKSTTPLSCWNHVRLRGRRVTIVYDADAKTNPGVQEALRRLVAMLEELGALVLVVYLPAVNDDGKAGVDDYLAAGGTVAELRMMAGPYQPVDVGTERLSRDEKLRAVVEDLERRYYEFGREHGRRSTGGETAQDVYLKLIEAARRGGKIHPDGIRVQKAHGPLALEAKVSSRTLVKCIQRLEEWGVLYRDNKGRRSKQAGHFVLNADVKHNGEKGTAEGKVSEASVPCTLHPRAPRLMWSRAKWKPTKKMIRNYRLGKLSRLPEPRERVKRMGKRRGHLLDALDCAGGTLTLQELGAITGRRPWDLVRRKKTERGREGLLVWLERARIVVIDGDTVSLAPDWLDRLEMERELGKEVEMAEIAERRYERKRVDYHEHGPVEAMDTEDPPPLMGPEKVEEIVGERAKEDLEARVEDQRRKVGITAETFVFDKLKALGQIRLALLMEVYEDAGGDPWDIPPAVRRMGCRIERLPEYGNRQFVFPPAERVA